MFDCLRFLSLTQLPENVFFLAQSSSKNLFMFSLQISSLFENVCWQAFVCFARNIQITELWLDLVFWFPMPTFSRWTQFQISASSTWDCSPKSYRGHRLGSWYTILQFHDNPNSSQWLRTTRNIECERLLSIVTYSGLLTLHKFLQNENLPYYGKSIRYVKVIPENRVFHFQNNLAFILRNIFVPD